MKKLTFVLLLLLAILPARYAVSAEITVENVSVKKIELASGNAWYSAKCVVINQTEKTGTIYVELQGIDRSGYELGSITLSGYIKAGEKIRLTDKSYMNNKQFKKIGRWQVKEVNLYD